MGNGWQEGSWTEFGSSANDRAMWLAGAAAASSLVIVALEPSGAGMAFATLGTVVIMPNLFDPFLWDDAGNGWSELKKSYDTMVARITELQANVEGTGRTARPRRSRSSSMRRSWTSCSA